MPHRLASASRPLLSFIASAAKPRCHRWPSSLARPTTTTHRRVSRFAHGFRHMASSIGVKGHDDLGNKTDRLLLISPPDNITEHEKEGIRNNAISGDEDACRTTIKIINSKPDADSAGETKISHDTMDEDDDDDDVYPMDILLRSSHRDGSIYRYMTDCDWKTTFRIADRSETRLEAMRFSHPTDCIIRDGTCWTHTWSYMLQIFSLRLAKIPVEHGSVKLYGYIAVRDAMDSLLNYFINVSRDDPIIVKQGSLIFMSGPKRGIKLLDEVLIEFDMRIKTGKHENEDLQLIDGVTSAHSMDMRNCNLLTERIHGHCGAIDITAACIHSAVEATVQVAISQVQGSFKMRLSCFTSGIHEEIRLFNGAIGEPCVLKWFVVAVAVNSQIDLRLKVAKEACTHSCPFKANMHGHANEVIKTKFALFAVNVTWSTLD